MLFAGIMPKIAPMKKYMLQILVLLWAISIFPISSVLAQQGGHRFPQPTGAVNDFAGVIPAEYRQSMEVLAGEVLRKTGVALVVATFPDIGDNSPEDFVNRLYQAWGIGKKGEDKGVLIFVAVKERKFRIETGYGVEGVLPDGLVGEIRDRYAIPYLRQGDYGQGLFKTMSAIAAVVTGDQATVLTPDERSRNSSAVREVRLNWRQKIWFAVILLIVLPLLLFTRTGRVILLGLLLSGGRGGGGGFGSFGGGGFGGFGGGSSGGGGAGGDY